MKGGESGKDTQQKGRVELNLQQLQDSSICTLGAGRPTFCVTFMYPFIFLDGLKLIERQRGLFHCYCKSKDLVSRTGWRESKMK